MRSSKRVIMFSPVNCMRSYSGFQYLGNALYEKGFEVELFAQIPLDMMSEAKILPYPVHSGYEGLLGRVPILRHFAIRWRIRRLLKGKCDAIILLESNWNEYFWESIAFHRRCPGKPFFLYCPELGPPFERSFRDVLRKRCLRYASAADMIIDVDSYRAECRQKLMGLRKSVPVIPNTLPLKTIPEPAPPGTLAKIAGTSLPKDRRVLLFTGLVAAVTLDEVTAIMKAVSENIFLLWFAHGSDQAIATARDNLRAILGENCFHISRALPRATLLSSLHEADAGLVAYSYRAHPMLNVKYAAPTKLYEYLAAGLPVVSYGNPSIKELVEVHDLGICAREDTPESLGHAIDELFARDDFLSLRIHVKEVFADKLCYEKCSGDVLERMCQMI